MTRIRSVVDWLGWWSLVLLVLTIIGLVMWWNWDRGRQLPLPPQARVESSEILGGLAKRTTIIAPMSVDDARAFYRDTLPQQGWTYCGTQTTPGCTNMANLGSAQSQATDVYRKADDQDHTGTTVEVWPAQNARGETQVIIWETTAFGGG